MSYMNREHLLNLADRCQAGAEQLTYEAEHAAEVLAERAGGDLVDPQQWAARQSGAAAAVRQYAQGLRDEVADMTEGGRPVVPEARIREAEKVALGAEMGGILIDGRRLAEAGAERAWSPEERDAILNHYRAERDAIEGSGLFEHVAEDGQVPFWQLRADTNQARAALATQTTTDDATTADAVPAPWAVAAAQDADEF